MNTSAGLPGTSIRLRNFAAAWSKDGPTPLSITLLEAADEHDALLAALKALADGHEMTIYGEGFDPEHACCPILDAARAAIRKAEGSAE